MRVLVCGGRDYDDMNRVDAALSRLVDEHGLIGQKAMNGYSSMVVPGLTIIHGGATGADELAALWASVRDVPCIVERADWTIHGKAAGPIRNQRMIDQHKPDLVIAFPGGRGTADMVRRAKTAGIEVRRIT